MTKPIIDTAKEKGASRLREFTRQEREAGTHPAVRALLSRPQMRGEENRRAMEYARIERGQMG